MSKTLKSITYNDDGSMDMTDSDGIVYKNCWLKAYHAPKRDDDIITECIGESMECNMSFKTGLPPEYNIKMDGKYLDASNIILPSGWRYIGSLHKGEEK